ncbi:MAG: hypothetical protein PHY48_16655, partial [Candidatus Cloacimonetes bacterium]|nr:hypothetical protein [Candidatus Cloacimonadota bacterium]
AAGRMAELHTWRNQTGNSDVTRWYYDLFTGAVTNKLYADGKGTAYTYLDDGRISTRKWARNIITTYGYADTATGSIRTTDYNDDTPSVTNYYNLTGQLFKVEDGTGTITFGYDLRGRLIAETNAFAVITRSYDTYGRYAEFILSPVNPVYPCQIIQYGYDIYNRLNAITAIIGVETNTFTYSYLSGTTLSTGYTGTSSPNPQSQIQTLKSFEPNRNLITTITNSVGSVPSVVSSFNYSNDSTGKRTSRIDYYNGSTVTNTFDYNIRDEVTNAVMNATEQSIVYDDIGNRQTSTVGAVSSVYTANHRNQYTAVNTGETSASLAHDDDGNMTWDGQKWHHTYDGENRLIASKPDYWDTTNGACMFEYEYNHKNLRVEKIKKQLSDREAGYPMNPSANPGTWNPLETRHYIWDGFNIAAEIIIDHIIPATNINYYTWGIDLSGTLQGAGGVGGLLCDTKTSSTGTNTYLAVGDANGNITEYIDNTGAVAAHGEHSTFGETKLSGAQKDDFTHWFSSKPFDKETGFVVYQRRYYEPILCRWLSTDPITEDGGLNLYGVTYNNSINLFDILGREASSVSKGYGTDGNGSKETFNLCKCVEVTKQIVYKDVWFGKMTFDDIFPPTSKPYKKKGWKCPKAYSIRITVKPKGGFRNRYQLGGDKCAIWNGKAPAGGLVGNGMNSIRFKPQVFFSGGNRGNSAPILWGYHFHPDAGTERNLTAEYPIRQGDTFISVSLNILDETDNDELGGCAYYNLETGQGLAVNANNVSTLTITY